MITRTWVIAAALLLSACGDDAETNSAQTIASTQDSEATVVVQSSKTTTASGLQYEIIKQADGPKPTASSVVTVHYAGELTDGTQFDSSYSRGEPSTFPLTNVIQGWQEGLQLMSVGSEYKFYMPAYLAYGERGAGAVIGPNEDLIFTIELLEINSN